MKQATKRAPASPEELQLEMDLDRFVPALLTFVVNRLSSTGTRTFKRRLKIGLLDFRVLSIVSRWPGVSGSRIAEVVDLDKGAVSRTLRSLHRRRLVSIVSGGNGTRTASLTPTGRTLYQRAFALSRERERKLLAEFSEADKEILIVFLHRLLAAMPSLSEFSNGNAADAMVVTGLRVQSQRRHGPKTGDRA